MTFIHVIFYLFSTIAVLSGMMVVAAVNPVRGALFLVLTFFAMAGVWLLLEAEFLALILVLVYVGAVMTLFLFVVMMLRVHVVSVKEGFVKYWWLWAAPLVLIVLALTIKVIGPEHFGLSQLSPPVALPADYSNLTDLGSVLYTDYAYPFEIAAVLLLTAIVAAISLTHRKPKNRKIQRVSQQIAVQRKHQVRLVNMPSERKLPIKQSDSAELSANTSAVNTSGASASANTSVVNAPGASASANKSAENGSTASSSENTSNGSSGISKLSDGEK